MNDLELCKAFAELEGWDTRDIQCGNLRFPFTFKYNPLTDLALNCAARDKYCVEIDYVARTAHIRNCTIKHEAYLLFKSELDIPSAVIRCILKSKGLYK